MTYRFSKRKRLFCFLVGLALCGFGVALCTRPELGTSPISSLPYVMTFIAPLSFGTWTVIVNVFLLLVQILILGKKFRIIQFSQMLAVCVFGFFIDTGMWLASFYVPEQYIFRLSEQILGCVILAVGINCELAADVTYLPGDGVVKAVAERWDLNFGKVKICFDAGLVVLAVMASLFGIGEIAGIREGTVVAALIVGFLVKIYIPRFRSVRKTLLMPCLK